MPDGLAVFTRYVGLPSETFIARHLTGLAPGRTLTVTTREPPPAPRVWSAPGAVVELDGAVRLPLSRHVERVARRLRREPRGQWRWEPGRRDLDRLAGALDQRDVGVVLLEYLDVFLPVVPWLMRRGLRVYAHGHGYDVSSRLRKDFWRAKYQAYTESSGVIVVSAHAKRRLVEQVGLAPELIHVLPCGVEVDPSPPAPPPERDTVEVVAVGRLVDKKSPLTTIEAVRRARRDVPGLRLTLVGDGPLQAACLGAVRQAGLDDVVRLLGARPHADVLALVAASDVFAQHSVVAGNGDEEGLPVGILEAMARAVPVVSTRHAGIPEAVEEGVNGLLVQEGDVEGMAAALVGLARDPARRRALGLAGHARALDRFSWQRECRDKRALLGLDVVAV